MAENKNLTTTGSADLALQQAGSLLSVTDRILARRSLVESDAWLDELIAWADENGISEDKFPRNKQKIQTLTKLNLIFCGLKEIPDSIGKLSNLTNLTLYWNKLTKIPDSI
ncbi:MAG: hypothetical protein KAU26_10170, partial [Methylococcales bacterium]|nr:hypothetical protein [Methylococcales bacterium]